jgi:hypothetical protein
VEVEVVLRHERPRKAFIISKEERQEEFTGEKKKE